MLTIFNSILSIALGGVIAWRVKGAIVKRHLKMQRQAQLEKLHQRRFKIVGLTPKDDVVENITNNNLENNSDK